MLVCSFRLFCLCVCARATSLHKLKKTGPRRNLNIPQSDAACSGATEPPPPLLVPVPKPGSGLERRLNPLSVNKLPAVALIGDSLDKVMPQRWDLGIGERREGGREDRGE